MFRLLGSVAVLLIADRDALDPRRRRNQHLVHREEALGAANGRQRLYHPVVGVDTVSRLQPENALKLLVGPCRDLGLRIKSPLEPAPRSPTCW